MNPAASWFDIMTETISQSLSESISESTDFCESNDCDESLDEPFSLYIRNNSGSEMKT
ncbi:hypothetical protein CEXT_78391, partial [Caerostris extrusa]